MSAAIYGASFAGAQSVTTQQYGNARTGVQSQESVLKPGNVNSKDFGKLFSLPVAGHVYAEPLYVAGLIMGDGNTHNVVFVATEQDNVYAFDADGNNPQQGYLWMRSMLGGGETWVSHYDVGNGNIYPDIGITGTPVIDPATNTLYVVAASKTTSGTIKFYSRLHALNLTDGGEKLNGPTTIQATVPGKGDGGTSISFNALLENQRPALALAATPNGSSAASVFMAYASHGDHGAYHGWVISYDAADISHQTGAWSDTPNGLRGGIWMPGSGLSSDDKGTIFGADGNGSFDANTGGGDYGDSAFALQLNGSSLSAVSSFTPSEQAHLSSGDYDNGTGGVMLLPDQSGAVPHLATLVDKLGTVFLVNRDNMGGYVSTGESSLQNFSLGYTQRNSFAFFNNTLFMAGEGGPLTAYTFNPQTERFSTTPAMRSANVFGCANCASGGTTPAVSANGTSDAIVWAMDVSGREKTAAILRAYDAYDITKELYDSTQAASNRDAGPVAIAFTSPVIANGHVFVGGINSVAVYGELVQGATVSIEADPTSIATGGSSTLKVTTSNATQLTLTGNDGSSYNTLPPAGGSVVVTPTATTTYTATATGNKGNVTAAVTVEVGVPTVTLSATPTAIAAGGTSTLTVTASNDTALTLTGGDGISYPVSLSGGTATVSPTTSTTYTATATGTGGQKSAAVTVSVGVPAVTIVAAPTTIGAGGSSTLTLTVANAPQVNVSGNDGSSFSLPAPGGTRIVSPAKTTTYTASASAGSQTASAATTVTVIPLPTVTISANPTTIAAGASSTLTVVATDATQVLVTGSDNSSFSLGVNGGTHTVTPSATNTYTVSAANTTGKATSTAIVTVTPGSGGGGGSCVPSGAGVLICQPAAGATAALPVTILAGARAASGTITAIRVYSDNIAVLYTKNAGATSTFQINQSVTLAGGTHRVVVVAYESTGGALNQTVTFTVGSGGGGGGGTGCSPAAAGAMFCSPTANGTVTSPFTLSAGATAGSGYLAAIRVYSDNITQTVVNNPQQTKSFAINPTLTLAKGVHSLVVVGYQTTGGAVSAKETITVQ